MECEINALATAQAVVTIATAELKEWERRCISNNNYVQHAHPNTVSSLLCTNFH